MLVWVQGSVFQVAAGSHPVQEIWGSHSLYRDQIQKLLRCCREPYQQIPLVITIQKKVQFDQSSTMTTYRFVVTEGKVKC